MRATPIAGFYFLYFATTGVLLPFLPAYLKTLDLTTTQVGVLLATTPTLALLAPPFWAHLADRSGKPERVLTLMGLGAALSFAPLLTTRAFGWLLCALAAYSFFASSVTVMIDSVAFRHVASSGGAYAHLRLFGSLGFVASSTAFGLAAEEIDASVVLVVLALIGGYALWSLTLRDAGAPAAVRPLAGVDLLRDRGLALLLATSCLHWIACAPFHGNFSIHVRDLGLAPWVVGLSAGLGVVAEVMVMYVYPRFAARLSARRVLFAAYTASALRWVGMAIAREPGSIIALSLLHGMTFGAFYVAAVGYVAERVPPAMRATGQALFVSGTFGLGGLLGYLGAGAGYDAVGGAWLFAAAAVLEVVAAVLVLGVRARSPRGEA